MLDDEIKELLHSSQYLIAICSPKSSNSDWVNKEVAEFHSLGRHSFIIPFIIAGTPNAENPAEECFCPALRRKDMPELLGVSVKELGRRGAVLRIIATMMNLRYDQLVMRDRKRRLIQRSVAVAVLAILLAVGANSLWYRLSHTRYYTDVVYRYELPVIVNRISEKDENNLWISYAVPTLRKNVTRLEILCRGIAPDLYWETIGRTKGTQDMFIIASLQNDYWICFFLSFFLVPVTARNNSNAGFLSKR